MSQEMILFTAVFGHPDMLFDPALPLPDVEVVCWTDMDYVGQTRYRMVKTDLHELPPPKRNRRVKIFWPEVLDCFAYSLYVDSTVRVLVDPRDLIQYLEPGSDIAQFRAFERDCLYEEARAVVRLGKDDREVVRKQVTRYRKEGILPPTGLWAGTVILRRHTPLMREFCQSWWAEVEAFSRRDQISFPYAVVRSGIRVSELPGTIIHNDFVQWRPWYRKGEGWAQSAVSESQV